MGMTGEGPLRLDRRALLRALGHDPVSLDALHLATLAFLRSRGLSANLATYDQRLAAAAVSEGFALADYTARTGLPTSTIEPVLQRAGERGLIERDLADRLGRAAA